MAQFVYQITVNPYLIDDELRTGLGADYGYHSYNADSLLVDTTADQATVDAIVNAHNPEGVSEFEQRIPIIRAIQTEARERLKKEMFTDPGSVDLAQLRIDLEAIVGSSTKADNAITNISNLFGYDPLTNAGYAKTVMLAIIVLA